jgi:hypothetical protein
MKLIEKNWVVLLVTVILLALIKFPLVFILMGIVALVYLVEGVILLRRLQKTGIRSTGKIMSYEISGGQKTPLVEFAVPGREAVVGKPFLYASTDLGNIISHKNSDKEVPVLYDPGDPAKFILVSRTGFNYGILVLGGLIGAGMLTVGICMLLGYIPLD